MPRYAHFWLHNLALPIMMVGLAMLRLASTAVEPIIRIDSITTVVGLLVFAVTLWTHRPTVVATS